MLVIKFYNESHRRKNVLSNSKMIRFVLFKMLDVHKEVLAQYFCENQCKIVLKSAQNGFRVATINFNGIWSSVQYKLMLKQVVLALILTFTVNAWSNLQIETPSSSNPFVGNKFTITNIKPIFGEIKLWINFGEKKLEFSGCNEDVFSGNYTIREKANENGVFEFELEEPFEVDRGCKPVNIIKAVLNSGALISPGQKQGSFKLSNPNYPSAFLLFENSKI